MTTKTQTKTSNQGPKAKKIQTKTEVRNAAAQADRLIRGIDNNNVTIKKAQAQIDKKIAENEKSTAQARMLIAGISNHALTVQPQTAPKTAGKPEKTAAKKETKPAKAVKTAAKPEKSAPEKKTTAKPEKKAKPEKTTASTADLNGKKGFKLDEVARDFVLDFKTKNAGKLPTAAEIYTQGCVPVAKKHGFSVWSRQSLYNQLKIQSRFARTGDGPSATFDVVAQKPAAPGKATDQDAEEFVKSVAQTSTPVQTVQ